jgi:hypothetical protein
MTEAGLKVGDKVKLIAIPPDVNNDNELRTRALFEACLGKTFTVAGLEAVEGLANQLVRLEVGHILGQSSSLQTIWVEPEYLQHMRSD